MIRHLEIPFARFGFSLTSLKQKATQHLLILAPAILFSFIGFVLVKPAPLVEHAGWQQVLLSILVLTVFVGLVEEVFYRGLLLPAAEAVFGRAGLFISAFVYMLMYWGTHSVGYIVMMAVIGVFFGWHAKRTRSLWGVTLAHSLMMAGILLYWPLF